MFFPFKKPKQNQQTKNPSNLFKVKSENACSIIFKDLPMWINPEIFGIFTLIIQ